MIVVVSGPSGVGKEAVIQETLKRRDLDKSVRRSISWTTRAPREGEIHDVNYRFCTKEEFEEKRRSKYGFLESNEYGDDLYGTPVEEIKGKGVVICEVDCNGASQIRKKFHNTLSVFILPPNYQELERRLYGRKKDSPASIARRLAIATAEIQEVEKFTCWIVNADLGVAAKDLWTFLINANLSRRKFPSPDFRDEVRLEAIRATFPLAMV